MLLYKILSVLLEYPTKELVDHWEDIEQALTLDHAADEDQRALSAFIAWAQHLSLTEFQGHYVKTFDLTPDNALYLTHHLFEEQGRDRGPALVSLSEYYKSEGFEIDGGELPDYLPLILEYVSTLKDAMSARAFLGQSAHVCALLAENLEKIESPYAPLLRIVERHGRLAKLNALNRKDAQAQRNYI